ncbi:MAG: exosortase/archaeosortase family protein [Phycisphaerae bacterium]|nr:exosortase/archaeosortase family protein [Phycisphaerae bacterium]
MSTVATNPRIDVPSPRAAVIEISGAAAIAAGAVLVAILIAVFWDFFRTQTLLAIEEPSDWGHTLVIPFVSGWFVWLRREQLLSQPFRPAWFGLAVMLLGLGWYVAALIGPSAIQHHNTRGAGVGLTIGGLCLLLFGTRAAKWLWFPVVYWTIFGQTIWKRLLETVTLRLQDWAASGAYYLLNGIGFETDIAGNVLTVIGSDGAAHPLNVAEACSGMRMLVAFLALGVAMAFVGLDRWWQRVALVLMGVPVAIAVNILRVATLGMLTLGDVDLVQGEFHLFIGLVWLVPAFLMYLGIQWCLQVIADPWTKSASPSTAKGGAARRGGSNAL